MRGEPTVSLPTPKGTTPGEFAVNSSGAHQIGASIGLGMPVIKGLKDNPKHKRLTRKLREELEEVGVTPPLEITQREMGNRGVGATDDDSPKKRTRMDRKTPQPKKEAKPKNVNTPKAMRTRKPSQAKYKDDSEKITWLLRHRPPARPK